MRFLLIGLLFLSFSVLGQNDLRNPAALDSVEDQKLSVESARLQQWEAMRLIDSLKMEELRAELKNLNVTQDKKKQELQRELQAIKSKDSIQRSRQQAKIDSMRRFVKGRPVVPFRDTLFYVFNGQGVFSPAERAEAIEGRIRKAASNYFFHKDSMLIRPAEHTVNILYGEDVIVGISENDALWMNSSAEQLAESHKASITKAILAHKEETSLRNLLKELGLAALVIGIVVIIIRSIGRLFRKTRQKIIEQRDLKIKGIKVKNYELFDSRRQVRFFLLLNNALKWFVILLVIYLALPILFSIFPGTQSFADSLLNYFLDPVKNILTSVWNYFPNMVTILVIVVIFNYIRKAVLFLKREIETGSLKINGFYPEWANPTYQIIRILLFAFMLIVIFPYLPGSDSPIFQGVSVFIGVLFTFGSAGALGNIVSGVLLTYMRAFKIGDRIKVADVTGDVIEKSLLVTKVKSIKNEIISVPNSSILNNHTVNFSTEAEESGLIIHTTVTMGYDIPWRTVHRLLTDAALETDLLEKLPAPFVLQTGMDDFYARYQINAYTRHPQKQALIYSSLYQNIQDKLNEAGIEITSPHFHANRDGNLSTLPPEYLPPNYKAPSFRVQNTNGSSEEKDQVR